jgi:mRNA-degrading endonuclease RelE of RelBE toxin-antitoxin system
MTSAQEYEYDVALSYAGEDRDYAAALADILKSQGVKVFYDQYEKPILWGKDLYSHLSDVYQNKAYYCVIFISKHYATKAWTKRELQAAQARALSENKEYILPVRLDDTEIPGLLSTVAYLHWPPENASTIADSLVRKLCERWPKSEPAADPISEPVDGSAIKRRSTSMVKQATSILEQQVAHSVDSDHTSQKDIELENSVKEFLDSLPPHEKMRIRAAIENLRSEGARSPLVKRLIDSRLKEDLWELRVHGNPPYCLIFSISSDGHIVIVNGFRKNRSRYSIEDMLGRSNQSYLSGNGE